ncbi:MAG: hypothetical protein AVDCRST_MAG91-3569 [uncultured Sphingomonadaceae bacterium]|uniref:DUF1996 domain-containing protein n=1 Tax=uncultured Sphingomonadaceae bacterium TaxID=169976 RepID=A0A6J4U182_9SPHN|nr:MAG: hypothetical protein AVDCRST_MAG91-3569 [uncultured Sphingomonadaceae bacterium]
MRISNFSTLRHNLKTRTAAVATGLLLASLAVAGGLTKSGTTTSKSTGADTSLTPQEGLTKTPPSPPPPPPPPPPPTTSGPIAGEASITSNFDVASELVPSWGHGAIPASAAPDVVGAFRFICNPGQIRADDPIVYPGQPGRAHLHQFFGNTAANAYSNYASLRTSGASTCNSPLNRSAYWMPAMMNGKGRVVRPDYVSIYYKRRPASDPKCSGSSDWGVQGKCVDLPRGLRFVFGHNMDNPRASTGFHFNCDGPGAVSGHFPSIVAAAKGCPEGAQLGAVIGAPECWDGKNLDSPDHRSHMAYPNYNPGYLKCPSTHLYVVPTFTMGAWYTTDADLDRSGTWAPGKATWHLSSDVMPGMPQMTPGTSFHADWFGAWDDGVMKMWTDHCVNKLLNCSGGDLGNGKQLRMFSGFSWRANPRVVDIPS